MLDKTSIKKTISVINSKKLNNLSINFSTLSVKTRNIFFYSIDVLHIDLKRISGPLSVSFFIICVHVYPFSWENFRGSFYYRSLPFLWENFRGPICYLSLPLLPHPILHVSKIIPSVVFGMSPGRVPLFWLSLSMTISVWQEVVGGIWWGSLKGEIFICTKMLHQV